MSIWMSERIEENAKKEKRSVTCTMRWWSWMRRKLWKMQFRRKRENH